MEDFDSLAIEESGIFGRAELEQTRGPNVDINSFTQKSQQAILAARDAAAARQHQQVHLGHLLEAIVGQTDTILYPLLARLEINPSEVRAIANTELDTLPRVHGSRMRAWLGTGIRGSAG